MHCKVGIHCIESLFCNINISICMNITEYYLENIVLTITYLLFAEGKPIPTELRKDEAELRKAIEFDDEAHESMN